MKLPIKKEWFDLIKSGVKDFEYRDAHITFVCEETGEELRKCVDGVKLVNNQNLIKSIFEDSILIEFSLSEKEPNDSQKETDEQYDSKMPGDENRYCSCGKKLGKNKGKGKCDKCLENKSTPINKFDFPIGDS